MVWSKNNMATVKPCKHENIDFNLTFPRCLDCGIKVFSLSEYLNKRLENWRTIK